MSAIVCVGMCARLCASMCAYVCVLVCSCTRVNYRVNVCACVFMLHDFFVVISANKFEM